MPLSPLAGKPAPKELLVDVARLERDYSSAGRIPTIPPSWSASAPAGTAESPLRGTFTEAHILAITQAICDYRRAHTVNGPLYMGKDTHALSGPAQRTALEVLAANGVETIIQRDDGVTPTPVISRAILVHNRGRDDAPGRRHRHHAVAQPAGGRRLQVQPAERRPGRHRRHRLDRRTAPTSCCASGNAGVKRVPFDAALEGGDDAPGRLRRCPTSTTCGNVVDMDAIRGAGLKLGVDPLGGASRALLGADQRASTGSTSPSSTRRSIRRSAFMTVDHDGKIRMDCSSPYAMARLVGAQGSVRRRVRQRPRRRPARHRHAVGRADEPEPLPGGRDPTICSTHRPDVAGDAAVGKTLVSSSMIDRVVADAGPPAVRGAGGLQVVRAGPVRRLVLLRRRGERRRELPAPRRHASGRPTRTA